MQQLNHTYWGKNGKVQQVCFDIFAIVLLNKGQNNVIDMFKKIFTNTTRWVFVNFDWAMVFYGEGERHGRKPSYRTVFPLVWLNIIYVFGINNF